MHRVERLSIREISRRTGLHRKTIRRALRRRRCRGTRGHRRHRSLIRFKDWICEQLRADTASTPTSPAPHSSAASPTPSCSTFTSPRRSPRWRAPLARALSPRSLAAGRFRRRARGVPSGQMHGLDSAGSAAALPYEATTPRRRLRGRACWRLIRAGACWERRRPGSAEVLAQPPRSSDTLKACDRARFFWRRLPRKELWEAHSGRRHWMPRSGVSISTTD